VPAASELELILGIAEQLAEELAHASGETLPSLGPADQRQREPWGPADAKHAQLVARLNRALAAIAWPADPDETVGASVRAALARTELVIRGELMRGNEAALREQLPGFVFLVVLPGAGMDRALELASRARVLLEEALG
jgi:hypothetical protein